MMYWLPLYSIIFVPLGISSSKKETTIHHPPFPHSHILEPTVALYIINQREDASILTHTHTRFFTTTPTVCVYVSLSLSHVAKSKRRQSDAPCEVNLSLTLLLAGAVFQRGLI